MDNNKRSNSGSIDDDAAKAKKIKIDIDSNAVTTLAALASSNNRGNDVSAPPLNNAKQDALPSTAAEEKKDKAEDVPKVEAPADPNTKLSPKPEIPQTANVPNLKQNEALLQTNVLINETKPKEDISKSQSEDAAFTMSQSERKRFREKQRRQNISAAIDALTKVLLKVDPTNFIEHNNQVYFATDKSTINDQGHDSSFRKRRSTGATSTSHHHQPLNRTEVINHATILIEKLASEGEEIKLKMMQLQHMSNSGDMSKGNGVAAMSMMSQFPLQQQPAQMMMVSNGMSTPPTAILMQSNPYSFPQYVVNGGQPGVMQWPMQAQQGLPTYITPGVGMQHNATPDKGATDTTPGTTNEEGSDKQVQQQHPMQYYQVQMQQPQQVGKVVNENGEDAPSTEKDPSGSGGNGEQQGNPNNEKISEAPQVKEVSPSNFPKEGSEIPSTADPEKEKKKEVDNENGNGNEIEPKTSAIAANV